VRESLKDLELQELTSSAKKQKLSSTAAAEKAEHKS
jgi:hypothetical protein